MNAIQYLLQVNLYLVLFYGFYRLLLKNETFHQNNRLFLLVGAGVSLLIPILQSDYVQDLFITDQVRETVLIYMLPMQFVAAATPEKSFTVGEMLLGVYGIGALIMGFKFLKNLLNLRKLLLNGVLAFRAFTFGRKIYVDQSLPESQTIHAHEAVHAQQLHSFDVIFFEILLIINWFNPVLYAYRQAVKNIHEFLADEIASDELGKAAYARLLLSQEFGVSPHHFITSFFDQSTLKQRINMLAKPKSRKTALLKYGLSAPLFITMLIVSSSFVSKSEVVEAIPAVLENGVIDKLSKKNSLLITPEKETLIINLNDALLTKIELPTRDSSKKEKVDKILPAIYVTAIDSSITDTKIINKDGSIAPTPLWVIDGKVIDADKFNLKPENIASMTVLKGEESTKIYGDKGKNGVIIITTKLIDQFFPPNPPSTPSQTKEQEDPIFTTVEKTAEFPGGLKKLMQFIGANVKYPAAAQRSNVQGNTYVEFIVRQDGSIENIKTLKGIGFGCDEEAIRVVGLMPKWTPASQNGKTVSQRYVLPISYKLTNEKKK